MNFRWQKMAQQHHHHKGLLEEEPGFEKARHVLSRIGVRETKLQKEMARRDAFAVS